MKKALFALICAGLWACNSDVRMSLPRGPQGLSAYQVWVEAVEEGDIDWDESTDPSGYFRYLKGEEGTSAYELWKEMVAAGLENPHDKPNLWPKDQTDENDFFRFLTGEDGGNNGGSGGNSGQAGKSAYQLWVEDVTDADGLDNPHTPAAGDEWPRGETSIDDFWRYLSADGEQSHNTIVEPGKPGIDFTPVGGKPNVIALYYQNKKDYSEYVDPADGSVTYQVYNADGTKAAAGVKITGMTALGVTGEPGSGFETEADGTFQLSKDNLPSSGEVSDRYGSVKVDGTPSASNTYVPQKVNVRLVIDQAPFMSSVTTNSLSGGIYMSVPIRAQRKVTKEGAWEDLPAYLTDVERKVRAYGLDNGNATDPTAPDTDAGMEQRSDEAVDLKNATINVRRPTLRVDWIPDQDQTDYYYGIEGDTPEEFTMVVDDPIGFYGLPAKTDSVGIATAPVNFHPLPKNLVMSDAGGGVLQWTSGSFDVNTDELSGNISTDLLFQSKYTSMVSLEGYTYWTRDKDASDNKCLAVRFSTGGDIIVGGTNTASIKNPDYTVNLPVLVNSYVYLQSTSLLIASPGTATPIGKLIANPDYPAAGEQKYIIRSEKELVPTMTADDQEKFDEPGVFDFPDIPIYENVSAIPVP